MYTLQPRWVSKWRLLGEQDALWSGIIPWLLTPKEPFCTGVMSPLSHREGDWRSLNPLLKQGFPSFCSCHDYYLDYCCDYYLKVFTRGKDWLFILFLLLLPFWRANRRLIVNSSTGAHLSLVSGNVNSSKYPAWSPLLPAPWNADRRPTVKVWPGAHLSPAKSVSY